MCIEMVHKIKGRIDHLLAGSPAHLIKIEIGFFFFLFALNHWLLFGQEHIKSIIDHNFCFYVQTLDLILQKMQKSYYHIHILIYTTLSDFTLYFVVDAK